MACAGASNVHALAIDSSFDDAQRILKELFGDAAFARTRNLSAVNSINRGRILAQSVYHLRAWLRLTPAERTEAEFAVPAGNFGNVFSGWLLTRLGVPIRGFHVATNRNDIMHRLFSAGDYRAGLVKPSLAPSMDIQAASNFERLLYYLADEDPARVRALLAEIKAGAPPGSRRCDHPPSPPPAHPTTRSPRSSVKPTRATATSSIRTPPAPSRIRRPTGRRSSCPRRTRPNFQMSSVPPSGARARTLRSRR